MPQPAQAPRDQFGPTTFTGKGVEAYQALVIASALDLYNRTGMKVNSAYTPTAMLNMATQLTGVKFHRREYAAAAAALRAHADNLRNPNQ